MPKEHRPRHGSMAYSPRKRSESEIPRFSSWPEIDDGPKLQGFAGYKAGMTHAIMVDYRPTSTTSGQEVQVPVTVVEVPPMIVVAVRIYKRTYEGHQVVAEIWANKLDKELARTFPIPKSGKRKHSWKDVKHAIIDEVRLIMHTQPNLVSGIPKKKPEIMENRVGGGTIDERLEYAKSLLGKELKITDFTKEGAMIDVVAVTKGKGWQGMIKRFGIKLAHHKDSKHRRMLGTRGTFTPKYIRPTVPQAGQIGYHQRTEYNKRIVKIGEDGTEITPDGGFLHYGIIKNTYVLVHGSIPGPTKRLIRFRDAVRLGRHVVLDKSPELVYISKKSKQGV